MEKYTIESGDAIAAPLNLGEYYKLVYRKHIAAYGETGADNIVQNIIETYKSIQLQLSDSNKNNNVLLVGKVQSGKTSRRVQY